MSRLVQCVARRGLLLWAASVLSCASLPALPEGGGPVWYRLDSEHFVLFSDLSESSARETIRMFERLLDAYGKLGWETHGKLPVKLHVVVFEDPSHFEVFAADYVGFHVVGTPFEPLVVMANVGKVDGWRTLEHELTHYIAFQSLPFQPPWLAEGLAGYFQTAYFDPEDRFVVGQAAHDLYGVLRSAGLLPARELLASESVEMNAQFYATSWLLVHYLMSERSDAFAAYQDSMARAQAPDTAWNAVFPDLSPERLDEVLARYVEAGRYTYFARPVSAYVGSEPSVSRLSNADIYALRAQLFLNCPACGSGERRSAKQNVEQALRLEPNHLRASVIQIALLPPEQRLPVAQALARAHPEAWIAWMVLASAELSTPGQARCTPQVSAHLREFGEASARALMVAAMCQSVAGERQDALELSARALRRQPADTSMLTMQASVLLTLRDCAALQRLIPRLRTANHPKLPASLLAQLDTCQPTASPAR